MMKQSKKHLFLGLIVFLFIAGITGCLKNNEYKPPSPKTYISVMHLAPFAPSAEVFFDNEKVTQGMPSGSFFSYYSGIPPATFDVKFKKAGADSLIASIASSRYDSLKFYTLLLYNDTLGAVKAIKINDDYSNITSDKSVFRFFNMSPDVPSADLYIQNDKVASGRTPADNTSHNNLNAFVSHASGSFLLAVKVAGTDSVISQINTSFMANNAYTVFLKGKIGGVGDNKLELAVLRANN